ncbi:MAG: Rieske 2Fe-2S domain-containing protein [Caldilineaceae bacterium]
MIDDPILLNDWHPVASLAQLRECHIRAVRLLGRELVVWQADAQIQVWDDLCIHRGARLSAGRLHGVHLACPYHGWRYAADGRCVHMPAHPEQTPPAKATAHSYPVQVRYDMV